MNSHPGTCGYAARGTIFHMNDFGDATSRQGASAHDRSRQESDLSRYSLTPVEALAKFTEAGLKIKLRTVQRYCRRKKIDCIKIDPETQELTDQDHGVYLVDEASVTKRIGTMLDRQELGGTTGHDRPRQDVSDHDQSRQDASAHDRSQSGTTERNQNERQSGNSKANSSDAKVVENLKDELQDARISAAGHKAVASQMRKDRDNVYEQLRSTDRVIGIFQDRILKLGGDPSFPELPDTLPSPQDSNNEDRSS